jgi:hypothetical protein
MRSGDLVFVHPQFAGLLKLSGPFGSDDDTWLVAAKEDVPELVKDAHSEYITLYASLPSVFVQAILAPTEQVTPPDQSDLLHGFVEVSDSWCIQKTFGGQEGYRVYLEPPLCNTGSKSIEGGEKLIFQRRVEGLKGYKPPIELSQRLVHALDVHFLPERSAYSRLNDCGDFEDIILVLDDRETDTHRVIVAIRADELARYLAVSGQSIVRLFDLTRVPKGFLMWPQGSHQEMGSDLFFNYAIDHRSSYANGRQIIRTSLSVDDLVKDWKKEFNREDRRYETFLIHDWKNKELREISAAPGATANYFTESVLPFEVSPAFFRPDVLLKYKADPDKYEIRDRAITCRNSWHLKTYDINDAGQVSTYIVYLRNLPFEEQQHWKLYNEAPKAPLSARAIKTDFEGDWDDTYDPLRSLKGRISALDGAEPSWWSQRGEEARDLVHYPVSTSAKEWADEILALSQMVVEGFLPKQLKLIASRLSAEFEPHLGSLKLLEAILEAKGRSADEAKTTVSPLRELQHLRTKVKGHLTSEGKVLLHEARRKHGSLSTHFRYLSEQCDRAMEQIVAALEDPVPPPSSGL